MPVNKPVANAASFAPGDTSSVAITASCAGGFVYLSANGQSKGFDRSNFLGIADWVLKQTQYVAPRRSAPELSRDQTLDILAKKLEAAKKR